MSRFARLAWFTLIVNVGVILWGAFVRASGSGAGCGAHWPLCNGEVVPRAPELATLVELTHRLTSGVALLLVVVLCYRAFRGNEAAATRRAAAASLFFMFTEAAVGAGLVLFELVADNASVARALFMAVHLVNTFFLLSSLTLTAHFASGGPRLSIRNQGGLAALLAAALGLVVLAGVSGAVAALGDTLYPAGSLAEALAADRSPTSHILVRLRLLHPALAIAAGVVLIATLRAMSRRYADRVRPAVGRALEALVVLQWIGGVVNVLLLAPIWMQIVHLLVADAVWIGATIAAAMLLREARLEAWTPHAEAHAGTVALSQGVAPKG